MRIAAQTARVYTTCDSIASPSGTRQGSRPCYHWASDHRRSEGQMSEDLLEVVEDGVAVLTMNRPDRLNAMSGPMLDAMLEALQRLTADPHVGVLGLSGAGRAFCAGGDVKAMAEGREFGGATLEEKAQALRSR